MPAENAGPDLREAFLYSSARHGVTRLVFDRNSRVNVEVHGAIQRFQLLSFAPVLRLPYDDGRSPLVCHAMKNDARYKLAMLFIKAGWGE